MALTSVPYLVAWLITPAGSHYTGFLINPVDGHSYLAKMGQGAAGSWSVRLPYTAEPHQPAFVYTYLLALGHLSPVKSPAGLLWTYHLARLFVGFMLMLTVYGAVSIFASTVGQRRLAMLMVGLSSGLGWFFGQGPDLTVPESITFASLLVNAHFGLTIWLMLVAVLALTLKGDDRRWWPAIVAGGVLLTMIQPYAAVVVGLVASVWFVVESARARAVQRPPLGRLAAFALAALPVAGYMLWLLQANPHYRQWMDQNLTPSPPVWQWLAGYGLLVPLAAGGVAHVARRRSSPDRLLLIWIGVQVAVMFLPIGLQRRLSTGLHLPLCLLAAIGVWEIVLPRIRRATQGVVVWLLLLLLMPSNLILGLAGVGGVAAGNPYLVMTDSQWQTLAWLRENASSTTVVLTDVEFGTLVPAWGGGARVIYGHPFETLEAASREAEVNRFFDGEMPDAEREDFLDGWSVDLVVVQTERYPAPELPGYQLVWQDGPILVLKRVQP